MRTLENNPKLEYLLKELVLIKYETNADISEESLIREYNFLKLENQLELLFELETLITKWNKEKRKDEIRTAYFNLISNVRQHPVYN